MNIFFVPRSSAWRFYLSSLNLAVLWGCWYLGSSLNVVMSMFSNTTTNPMYNHAELAIAYWTLLWTDLKYGLYKTKPCSNILLYRLNKQYDKLHITFLKFLLLRVLNTNNMKSSYEHLLLNFQKPLPLLIYFIRSKTIFFEKWKML